jgi:cobalt-zinc-cadmium efflux system membrane fusion protein
MIIRIAAAFAAVLLFSSNGAPAPAHAHEGHGDAKKPMSASASVRAEGASGDFELVAVAKDNALILYLDHFVTNAPIAGASIVVETPSGSQTAISDGDRYRLDAPFLATPGRHDLIVTVTAGNAVEVIPLTLGPAHTPVMVTTANQREWLVWLAVCAALAAGAGLGAVISSVTRRPVLRALGLVVLMLLVQPGPVVAHEGHKHAGDLESLSAVSGELAQKLTDGTIYVPKPVQRIFGLRTIVSTSASYRSSAELAGRIIPDPNASGFVQASVGGRLSPPQGGFPRLGTPVKKGDVLAHVTPPLQAIDVSDMRQRRGELDQQISIVEQRLTRYERLAPAGAIPRQLLDEARLELEGLMVRRASLERSRAEPESLIAPADGVIADGTPVAGQIVQPNAVVFHIIDPAKLWVEAFSFSTIRTELATATAADGKSLKLAFRGSGFADRNQAITVHFAIEGDTAGLRAGQFVNVIAEVEGTREGIAVPRASVVRNANGQDFVFEHVAAERFVARPVRTEPLDGERTLILAGITPDKRIVVQGAELLDHVR